MKYIKAFYDFLIAWGEAIYEYRNSKHAKYYY